MIRDTYEDIIRGIEVRQNLSKLRGELKAEGNRQALLYHVGKDLEIFETLLSHEDAKTRKNAALLIGDLKSTSLLEPLYKAYEKETTLFVKSAYLTAMKELNYEEYLPALKKRMEELLTMDIPLEERKHRNEEIRALEDLFLKAEGIKAHSFSGYNIPSELVLLTNRNFKDITLKQLETLSQEKGYTFQDLKEFSAGVMVTVQNPQNVLLLSTFEELLFAVKGMKTCPYEPLEAAKKIMDAGFIEFLTRRHSEPCPFYFRIECKSRQPLDRRSAFSKKLAAELERLSGRQLINSTSNYEIELRMIENKSGGWNVLVKLYTLKDSRFSYRKESLPVSIKPANAALVAALAKDYLIEEAKILDPFCGTGTMLIERHKFKKANTMYGIDLFGEAIEKAKRNTSEAGLIIHYINRDFFDFTHEYLFDEIITNMPFVTARKTEEEIYELYRKFFRKAREHMTDTGLIILHSHNRSMVLSNAAQMKYEILEEWEISKKEGTYVFVLKNDSGVKSPIL